MSDDQTPTARKNYITKNFQEPFVGMVAAPSSWKIVKLVFLRKPRRRTPKWNKRLQGRRAGDVVHIVYCSSSDEREKT